ncbi:MAG: hypothetical protein NC548_58655 [Lachnospiraceae bacterium]|nr:hypothetical protein [Lachnospiraceae bacterium]
MDLKEKEQHLQELLNHPNSMSYWLPKFRNKGFHIPDTIIIPLTVDWYDWLWSDSYKPEKIQEFTDWINEKLKETGFNTDRELFIKTGNFSNKFWFKHPYLKTTENIGEHYLNVFYGGMCVGCMDSPEICVREFIHTDYERKSIYSGMKLNTEFRVFYDFDKQKIVGMFNYWDRETMQKHLYDEEELRNFNDTIDDIESDFNYLKPILAEMVEKNIKAVDLDGVWSIDFMWDGQYFWLIDAALGKNSYYFEKLREISE